MRTDTFEVFLLMFLGIVLGGLIMMGTISLSRPTIRPYETFYLDDQTCLITKADHTYKVECLPSDQ